MTLRGQIWAVGQSLTPLLEVLMLQLFEMCLAATSATAATPDSRASTARWTSQSATPAPVNTGPCAWRVSVATHASAGQVKNYIH